LYPLDQTDPTQGNMIYTPDEENRKCLKIRRMLYDFP
jgi:hypothetical protein